MYPRTSMNVCSHLITSQINTNEYWQKCLLPSVPREAEQSQVLFHKQYTQYSKIIPFKLESRTSHLPRQLGYQNRKPEQGVSQLPAPYQGVIWASCWPVAEGCATPCCQPRRGHAASCLGKKKKSLSPNTKGKMVSRCWCSEITY